MGKKSWEDRLFGHSKGVEAVRETLKTATELKVKYLTLYAFSTENWNRPQKEVEGLMNLLVHSLSNEVDEMNQNGVRLQAIGNIKGFLKTVRTACKMRLKKQKPIKRLLLFLH